MTQPPPPPPNQPPDPQGGFGAPPPPQQPEPGYGYPQQAPQPDPGYGYPQQAPDPGYGYPLGAPPGPQGPGGQPPATPPQQPYGYPAQPPTQPQQPYGAGYQQPAQPPYGYPQQQPYGGYQQPATSAAPAAAPGGGKKLSAQLQIVIAAVVAVVLIIGAGIWYANSGDGGGKTDESKGTGGSSQGTGGGTGGSQGIGGDGKEKAGGNTKAKPAFQLDVPKVPDTTPVAGSWVTDKVFVKTGVNSVVGYDLDKGTVVWTLPLTGQVCGASRHMTADHKVPILFEAAKRVAPRYYRDCTEVGVVDLNTGKLDWSTSVTGGAAGDAKVRFGEVTLSGRTVAAGGLDGGAAFDVANGNPRWKPQANAQGCYDLGYGGGEGLVAVRKCGSYDAQYVMIQNLDPMTGAPLSQYKMPTGVKYASVVSAKPLVVAADVGDSAGDGSGISDFFSLDEKTGKLKAKITADADQYAARCRSTKVEACTQALVGNGRLYVPTEEHEGSTGEYGDETNEVIAFDLATGKTAPEKADAGDKYTLIPLRMDGGDLIAYKEPPYDKGGQIVSIHGGTMKETLLLENPSDKVNREKENSFSINGAEFLYEDGRLFISPVNVSKTRESDSAYDKRYLAVAYSTKG
ncbi:PQQ-binding-like beta-propeller repeat protein [Streptomyces sp. NBC_00233]|uniref:outer membrane protein assembly factor BamB family protein n=1 Tax=Streptomyces sp. NBC_00233 TaxID=2975686 RepID=UPI002256F04C|nr:PQQ-binding-like beta-propeller repeat protein [Streptomyces sp. NBC_00233]MCX5226719.1 PQQ-binding-like beta-propeller repeat protein [Streptomyces sp. NBC_00233]